ncbi:MAG: hypothetical protein WCX28_02075 [Bacteriovoracaceae bacterium]|nr:hypothetical protein [Bacteroidota bacterium]
MVRMTSLACFILRHGIMGRVRYAQVDEIATDQYHLMHGQNLLHVGLSTYHRFVLRV